MATLNKPQTLSRSAKCVRCKCTIHVGGKAMLDVNGAWYHYPTCGKTATEDDLDALINGGEVEEPDDDDNPEEIDDTNTNVIEAVSREVKYQLGQAKTELRTLVNERLQTTFNEQMPGTINKIATGIQTTVGVMLADALEATKNEMKAETSKQIARILNEGIVRQEIVIKDGDTVRELKGEVFHPRFQWLMKLALAGKPIFIPGPTGSGKTHLGQQLARALGRPFGMISCSPGMTETKLAGRSIPKLMTGEDVYRSTEFVKCYEHGGVFLFDEMDAADATVLLVINSALANGVMPLPDRTDNAYAKMHKDFVCIGAANTFGAGADRQYVGRNRLDEATLDRFRMGTVPIDYAPAIERALCPDPTLYDTFILWRNAIRANRLERVLSTRFMRDAYDMAQVGATLTDIAHAFFAGWPVEQVKKVYGGKLPDLE